MQAIIYQISECEMEQNVWEDVLELGPECHERYINLHNTPELADLNIQASGISNLKGLYKVGRTNMQSHTLIFSVDGKGMLHTKQGRFSVEKSTLITLPAGTSFVLELESSHWTTVWFELQDYPDWRHVCENKPLLSFNDDAAAVYHLLALIDQEQKPKRRQNALILLASYLSELSLEEHLRIYSPAEEKHDYTPIELDIIDGTQSVSDVNRLTRLFKDVNKQLHYPWTVEEMSVLVHYSAPHFHRLCKRYFARSPIQQLIYLRIQRAKYLLRHTHWTISQISGHVGYQDIYNFSKRFRKSVGKPPSRFRVENRV